jgi:hypothetical protein
MFTYDRRTIDSTGAFLQGELEKLDATVNLPLVEVTWQRDIDLREDVVMSDESAGFTLSNFAAAGAFGAGKKAWAGKNSTALTGVAVDISKTTQPLHLWGMVLNWSVIELEAAQRLNRPIDTQKYDGMKLKNQMDIDEMVYIGDTDVGAVGLINHPSIPPYALQADYANDPADEILADLNKYLEHAWGRAGYTLAPDQLRLPPVKFAGLLRPVTVGGDRTILDFVSKQCVSAAKNGRPLEIQPLKWLTGAGVGGKDRVVSYTRDKKYVRFPLVPMQKTPLEQHLLQQQTAYYCKFGQVEFVYPETIAYGDAA